MSFLLRIASLIGIALSSDFYVTIRETELKKKTGRLSGIRLTDGFSLECDTWAWDSGELKGYHRIISGSYLDLFVADSDIEVFVTSPPSDVARIVLTETDGTIREFDEVL